MKYCEFNDKCPIANGCLEDEKWNCPQYKFYTIDKRYFEEELRLNYERGIMEIKRV